MLVRWIWNYEPSEGSVTRAIAEGDEVIYQGEGKGESEIFDSV